MIKMLIFTGLRNSAHSIGFRGKGYHSSAKAAGSEDLEVEAPVSCWDGSSFHFDATVAGMLGPALIRHQVVQMRQPCEKRLLTAAGMMKPLHGKQFPLNGVVRLV
jgi:hypothetical protein